MRNYLNKLLLLAFAMLLLGNLPLVSATEVQDELTDQGFSYEVIRPDNQINPEVSYFDLKMTPGQKQTTTVKLFNDSSQAMKIAVALNGAKTNSNGVIEYGPNEIENDPSLKYDFADLVTGPKEVTIPANGSTDLELEIQMPAASVEGLIAGAIQLQKIDEEERQPEGMIINKFAYLIGMILSEEGEVLPEKLAFNKVFPDLKNYRNAVIVNFSNVQADYLEGMTVDVEIMEEQSERVLYETKKTGMRMAPNTQINFPISLNGEEMVAGDYRAKIVVTSAAGGRWEWLEGFKISRAEADKYNQQDVSLIQTNGINWQLLLVLVSLLLLLVVIIYLIIRRISQRKNKHVRLQK